MIRFLSPVSKFDRSPLQFQMLNQITTHLASAYENYVSYNIKSINRLDSNHLLFKILTLVSSVPFKGDLLEYVEDVNDYITKRAGQLDLTTHANKGKVHKKVFYNGVNEIITICRSTIPPMDLWHDWKKVEAIKVLYHPVTTATLFNIVADNSPKIETNYPYSYINIDPGLLAAQWKMFQANDPEGTRERFLTTIVSPTMFKSHLDIVMFNKVCLELGLISKTKSEFNSNYLGAQPNLDTQLDRVAKQITEAILSRPMAARQILATVPTLLSKSNALEALAPPELMRTQQDMWAIHSQAFIKALFVLEVARRRNDTPRILELLPVINRDNLKLVSERWYASGLSSDSATAFLLTWERILEYIPKEYAWSNKNNETIELENYNEYERSTHPDPTRGEGYMAGT